MKLQIYIVVLFTNIVFGSEDNLELIFVHTIWRHGDRSPEGHLNNDPIDPSQWIFGGKGYSQLTARGMAEQFLLGKQLRQRYIEKDFPGFLQPVYDSREIFIRSTDSNRTLNSATANMFGMFSSNQSQKGIDYPDIAGWPKGFLPVPIHAPVSMETDCDLNTMCKCIRRNQLHAIAHTGEQFQTFLKDPDYLNITEKISQLFNNTYSYKNLWFAYDAINIQSIYFPKILKSQPWYSKSFFDTLENIEIKTEMFAAGFYSPPIINGIDVKKEILKLGGGLLANEISSRMRKKVSCVINSEKCDSYHKLLKYYAYSTHDHTLISLMAVFGLENIVAGPERYGEWPDYSADIVFELYINKTSELPYFRALYKRNATENFEIVTHRIKGCKSQEFCEFKIFENRAKEYRIDEPIDQFCQKDPEEKLKFSEYFVSSSFKATILLFTATIFMEIFIKD